jgi:hypothetical protein
MLVTLCSVTCDVPNMLHSMGNQQILVLKSFDDGVQCCEVMGF